MQRIAPKLQDIVGQVVEGLGYELVGIDFQPRTGDSLLRVYIDQEQGIGVEDCSAVSHQLSGALDVEDPIPGGYSLEISSPGLDRPLFLLEHFERFQGHMVKLRLHMKLDGQRRFKGRIERAEGDTVQIESEGKIVDLPYAQIEKANLIPEF